MTEQETRGKIFNIIREFNVKKRRYSMYTKPSDDEELTNALIAAGIGDVSKLKNHRVIAEYSLVPDDDNPYIIPNVPLRVTQLYSGEEVEQIVKEREEYKHRAEVAERALKIAYNLGELCAPMNDYIRQAEKELAEERKDD